MRALPRELIAGVALSVLVSAPAVAHPLFRSCPRDSVRVGSSCVDTYEASVWNIPATQTALIKKVQKGRATLADLTAGGATPVSQAGFPTCAPSFPGSFPVTGNWTAPLYAVSVAGVLPTACITWFQAAQACALSKKHLLTNEEWQRAAVGTPDPGTDDESTLCNISGPPFAHSNTGSRSACVSTSGAFDIVGNVWEMVADWGDIQTSPCTNWPPLFGNDLSCIGGNGFFKFPGRLVRGNDEGQGIASGVFAASIEADLSDTNASVGFRCGR